MSWISKFFGNNTRVSANAVPVSEKDVNVLEDLFVDKNAPIPNEEKVSESAGSLKTFLEQNFFERGIQDGYEGHSAEVLENKIRCIKADFRYNINLKIDQARQEIMKLDNHRIEVEGMSATMARQLENQILVIKANITEMESEIALSAVDEGLAMVVINQYRDGFMRGTEFYRSEKLIAGSTGMFNN